MRLAGEVLGVSENSCRWGDGTAVFPNDLLPTPNY